ncbi:MAG: type II secretion system F family protein [Armatimonadetes bacterium]|nr:type II secretion system F family protein [Armatimonadota bacterium]MDW8120966.1 type II secretion system F family protein [Armatimonadota bacterium]
MQEAQGRSTPGGQVTTTGFQQLLSVLGRLLPQPLRLAGRPLIHRAGVAGKVSLEELAGMRVLSLLTLGGGGTFLSLWVLRANAVEPPATYVFILAALFFPVIGFEAPAIYLRSVASSRRRQVLRSLPDFVDLLATSVEAGLALDAAVDRVVRRFPGPLADEFRRYLWEVQIGRSRNEALLGIAERTDVEDVRLIAAALGQAELMGIPVADVLRTQAEDLRLRRLQRVREQAMRAPVRMVLPLALCFCPVLFILLFTPLLIRLLEAGINPGG